MRGGVGATFLLLQVEMVVVLMAGVMQQTVLVGV